MGGDSEHRGRYPIEKIGNVIFGADRQVAEWVRERVPGYLVRPNSRSLGIALGNRMVGGVVYEGWNGVNVEGTIASEPGQVWLNRDTLHRIFAYPFVDLGCHCMTIVVAMSNVKSLNLVTKMGFQPEAIVAFAAHDGSDALVLKMFSEQCRWIKRDEQGRRYSSTS